MNTFIPTIPIELEYPDGRKSNRSLRFDLRAARLTDERFKGTEGGWANAPAYESIPFLLFAMTSHERKDGDSAESFELCLGPANMDYFAKKLAEAMGRANSDDEENPTKALVNGQSTPTGKGSKRSPKLDLESTPTVSTQ